MELKLKDRSTLYVLIRLQDSEVQTPSNTVVQTFEYVLPSNSSYLVHEPHQTYTGVCKNVTFELKTGALT